MISLLADHDIELYAKLIWGVFSDSDWLSLGIQRLCRLSQVGLSDASTDRTIWLHCQAHQMLLITANRNEDGDDSLGNVIAELNSANSLPVLTMANARQVLSGGYREECAYRIADTAIRLDELRGSGRLFIP